MREFSRLQRYPQHLHPQMMVEGATDPGVRSNALASLAEPEGLLKDVRDIVVTPGVLHLTVRDIEKAFSNTPSEDSPDPVAVRKHLDEPPPGDAATIGALADAAHWLQGISLWALDVLGPHRPDINALQRLLVPFAHGKSMAAGTSRAVVPDLPDPASDDAGVKNLQRAEALSERVRDSRCALPERDAAKQAIAQARIWFEHHEPSSPVALLLLQAERLVGKRFSEIVDTIPPDLIAKWDADQPGVDNGSLVG